MSQVNEPRSSWGGSWTELKLDAFENYVSAYLNIMNAQKHKYNGWPTTIYFDGFAGSGKRNSTTLPTDNNLFTDYLMEEELDVYKGSVERVLRLLQKFDHYFFVDNDKTAISNLKQKLLEEDLLLNSCNFISDNVNNQLAKFSEALTSKDAALVLLDPFGMQIDWKSIEKFKDKRVDLWILIPSGVIINRFLDKKGQLLFANKLESYFGLNKEEIQLQFYEHNSVDTLFGSVDITVKASDSISKIADLYVSRLRGILKYVSDIPLKLYNSKNVPIYHFVFASNNPTALKIAKQIIEKKRK